MSWGGGSSENLMPPKVNGHISKVRKGGKPTVHRHRNTHPVITEESTLFNAGLGS